MADQCILQAKKLLKNEGSKRTAGSTGTLHSSRSQSANELSSCESLVDSERLENVAYDIVSGAIQEARSIAQNRTCYRFDTATYRQPCYALSNRKVGPRPRDRNKPGNYQMTSHPSPSRLHFDTTRKYNNLSPKHKTKNSLPQTSEIDTMASHLVENIITDAIDLIRSNPRQG